MLGRTLTPRAREAALFVAALNGHVDIVKLLVRSGVDVNARVGELGDIPLHAAATGGCKEVARILLEFGANLHGRDVNGSEPFFDTVHFEHVEMAAFLLGEGVDPNVKDAKGRTLLFFMSSLGKTRLLPLLLYRGADVDARSDDGETPLMSALSHGKRDAANALIDAGARVDVLDGNGATALNHAAFGGLFRLCERLLALGANPNLRDTSGDTPVHVASSRGFWNIRQLLIDRGADPLNRNNQGASVFDVDRRSVGARESVEMLRLLRALPPAISLKDMIGLREHFRGGEPSIQNRLFLEALVFEYEQNPARVGDNPVLIERVIEEAAKTIPEERMD
jgi:ankyrin repeat protein